MIYCCCECYIKWCNGNCIGYCIYKLSLVVGNYVYREQESDFVEWVFYIKVCYVIEYDVEQNNVVGIYVSQQSSEVIYQVCNGSVNNENEQISDEQ